MATIAIVALTRAIKKINYAEVIAIVERTDHHRIALAIILVLISYGTLTIYDVLALRNIKRSDVPYRGAALASLTSYPIAHGFGAVALIAPIIRYRVYSHYGLSMFEVAKISFLTGLTFWLGNLTALGLSVLRKPDAISRIDYLPAQLNQWLGVGLLLSVAGFVAWSWFHPRSIGTQRWPVKLPSGPVVLLQIAIGLVDLGAAALAMYVLIQDGTNIALTSVVTVFIAATLLGFASHSPAGIGVFDAAILLGLGGEDKEPLIAALLMFRFLYHFLPFVLALGVFSSVEGWRSFRIKT